MQFSLIICTRDRSEALARLLNSVNKQTLYPNEILVIDSSSNEDTEQLDLPKKYFNLKYFRVGRDNSGLTRQRNYGIEKSCKNSELICFLDDDIVLEPNYFKELITTYLDLPDAIAVGGWIKDETKWKAVTSDYKPSFDEFLIDGYVRTLGRRNVIRKSLRLLSTKPPGFMPEFSHGFSTGYLPPSGNIYRVEYFMGGVSSYRRKLFDHIEFSPYFEGYGLYEDMDFCLRASKIGKLYVNTAAQVWHLHEQRGRPNDFNYGRMVIENGYYVWKIKYPKSGFSSKFKYFSINILLMVLRFINGIGGNKGGFRDAIGRCLGLFKVLILKS